MKYISREDTIVALSTPMGSGAIAVVRLSGAQSLDILNPLLKRAITPEHARQAVFNELRGTENGASLDQVVTTFFQSPKSYTGEDLVEISCHCNPLIINRIISEIVRRGARIADPGEFTFRAFLNGKMDLSQAEAVSEIISARSRQSVSQSLRHLEGRLSEKIHEIKTEILNHLALLEINLDFSDEEIEVMPVAEMSAKMRQVIGQIESLLNTYDYGRLLQEGVKLLILGKPNVGKSSLLNQLLQRDRAIVSDIPGTTRDYIEATMELDGLAVQAVDTAGIRKTEDKIEAIGVQRAMEHIQTADVALCIFDGHTGLDADDRVLLDIIRDHGEAVNIVLALNKSDLPENSQTRTTLEKLNFPLVQISAKTGAGAAALKHALKQVLISDTSMESEEIVVTSARHKNVLERTITALQNAIEAIEMHATEEIISVDIRLALDCLGEITGETTPDDVINHIFANFCIGK
ncbi:MAG: tRNA uridine-5-carboxymethylaminomethyl(34) synthesis GTPase MnmE [Calditrichia bacterium]